MAKRKTNKKKTQNKTSSAKNEPKVFSKNDFSDILTKIQIEIKKLREDGFKGALLSQNAREKKNSTPFHVLIGCIISLRTKDTTTAIVSEKLFKKANSVQEMAKLSTEELFKV